MHIHKIQTFIGPGGELIEQLNLVDCDSLEAVNTALQEGEIQQGFFGNAKLSVPVMAPNGQPLFMQQHDIKFPINASTRNEAFQKFHSSLEEFLKEQRKLAEEQMKQQQSQIIVPNAAQSQSIKEMPSLKLAD